MGDGLSEWPRHFPVNCFTTPVVRRVDKVKLKREKPIPMRGARGAKKKKTRNCFCCEVP